MAADESINENELISNVVPNDMNEGSLLGDIDVIRNYGTILGSIVHHDIPIHDLKEVIPQTPTEFAVFYDSISKELYSNSQRKPFHYADSLIALFAFRDSSDFFIRFLNMYYIADIDNSSEEYMENLFYEVDFAIEANYTKFIKIFNSMSKYQKECFSSFVK